MASRPWLSLCLVLFAYNLMELLSDRYQLNYKIVERGDKFFDEDRDLNYLACVPFGRIRAEDSLFYDEAIQNVSVRSFLKHSIASIEHTLKASCPFHLNESVIFNDHVCFPTSKSALEEEHKTLNELLEVYHTFKIFIHSKEKQPNFYERAYEKFDFLPSISIKAYKQKVFGANHLLNVGCSNRTLQIHHDRFRCLNSCFLKLKLKSAFYHFDDDGIFDLDEIVEDKRFANKAVNNEEKVVDNPGDAMEVEKLVKTLDAIEGAEDCLKECPENSCFWEEVITLKIDHDYYRAYLQNEGKDKVDLQLNTYVAFYSMDDFCLQLFGLLALFTGTSILGLLHALLSLTNKKLTAHFKNERLLRILRSAYPKLKFALTLLSFGFVLSQSLVMISEFRFHSSHPNRTSTLNFSSEPFSVVFCFCIENSEGDGKIEAGRNSAILRNLSFASIEEASSDLYSNGVNFTTLYSGLKQIEGNFRISNEVLFKSSKFDDRLCLSRCIRVDIDLDERHRKMTLTYLWIEFTTKYREIFLIERNRNLTSSGLVNFRGLYNPQKITKKYSQKSKKSNCRDYSNESNCDSKRNCLDRCLSTKFIERHGSIPTNTVVSKSHLSPSSLAKGIKFNETADIAIEEECSALFNQTDCNEVRFEESPELVDSKVGELIWKEFSIRLSYMNIVESEMEYELVNTLLNIVSVETVVFGSNALGVLGTIFHSLSKIFRFKWRRAYSVCLLLVAGTGFLAHNLLVFRAIISGDLIENEFFEKPERYTLPSVILCFDPTSDADENHLLTGEYMDSVTDDLTFKQAFAGIGYRNRTHKKILRIIELNSTGSSTFYFTPELELTHFYYLGLKCFKISLKVSFKEEDFFLIEDKSVLEIYLNRTFTDSYNLTLFLHQPADFGQISGGFQYDIGEWKANPNKSSDHYSDHYGDHYSYDIVFELFQIVREDRFELLKDLRRLFQKRVKVNDVKTGEAMRKRFKEDYNRTTDDLPLESNFETEVDNELFEQHARSVADQANFKSLNFKQNVANTFTNVFSLFMELDYFDYPDFSFSFSFLVRRVVITNRENYTKIVVHLLNTLSLWLEVFILDMGVWLKILARQFLHIYRLLVNVRNRLNIYF